MSDSNQNQCSRNESILDLIEALDEITIMDIDFEGHIYYCNDPNYSKSEDAESVFDILAPELHQPFQKALSECVSKLQYVELQGPGPKFKNQKWCKYLFMPHKKMQGYALLVSFDISPETERLESLRYSEERFRQMIESSNQIFWIVEFNPRKAIYVSPAYEKIFNQSLEKIFENPNAYLESVHPDDVDIIKNRYTDLEAETDDEYRIIDPEGSIRWLHSRTFPVKDPGGRIYRKCGIVEDITERKEAGEQLKKERKALMEKNITLKEVLEHIEEEKRNFRMRIAENIQQIIMPTLRKIVNDDGTVNKSKLMVLKNSLGEMALISGGLMHLYSRLSPREVEICTLIRNGATTKEIADALYISTSTVKKHREKIRKKLQITNRKTNLASFLKRI